MAFTMYQAQVLDHAKHPRHWGVIEPADARAHVANPLCGDELDVTVQLDGDRLSAIGFDGQGCAISKAAASMLAEASQGKSVEELETLKLEDVIKLLGVPVNSARIRCASLGLEALQQALHARGSRVEGRG